MHTLALKGSNNRPPRVVLFGYAVLFWRVYLRRANADVTIQQIIANLHSISTALEQALKEKL